MPKSAIFKLSRRKNINVLSQKKGNGEMKLDHLPIEPYCNLNKSNNISSINKVIDDDVHDINCNPKILVVLTIGFGYIIFYSFSHMFF